MTGRFAQRFGVVVQRVKFGQQVREGIGFPAPESIFRISQFLPYYYQMYFPAAILTGRLEQAAAMEGLLIQAFWVVALLGLGQFLWQRGLRRHTAVGG